MKAEILAKLNTLLTSRIHGEYEVVYLMVELRKLLDRDVIKGQLDKFPLVRFHADWVVHTKKDHITDTIKTIMDRIEKSIDVYPKDGTIDFLLLPEFRLELTELLKEYQLPDDFCIEDRLWYSFMISLSTVLADQPIINPSPNIAEFRYIDIKKEGIMANIEFRSARAGSSVTLGLALK